MTELKKIWLALPLVLASLAVFSQHQELGEQPGIWKEKERQEVDSNSLLFAFRQGTMNGHLRYFFMATDNAEGLSDYHAHAAGGGIKFQTARFKGFQLGISGFFTYNIGSSDLSLPDPKTGQFNRYEIGLFDIEDPNNRSDIDRLEELFLKYNFGKSHIVLGKQLINTPFINLQDGRMRPTEVSGLWTEINAGNTKVEGGLLNKISPRGTVKWYSVEESIGVYSQGLNTDGSRSDYAGNTSTKGVAMLGITHQASKALSLKFWNLYTENIFNATLLQADIKQPLSAGGHAVAGLQLITQHRVGNGGNDDPSKRYMQQKTAMTFGGMVGWENKQWKTSLNFNRITAKGRYTMPREWGRDPFYTFISRERNEGYGDVNAYVIRLGYSFPGTTLKLNTAFGYVDLPDVSNYSMNKMGMPSYTQTALDLRYDFKGILNGLGLQVLYIYKAKAGNKVLNDRFIINKVNMGLWNMVLNYNF